MNFAERLERRAMGLLRFQEEKAFDDGSDICLGFARVSRAIRQIIVLEQELKGLRQPVGLRAPANANSHPVAESVRAAAPARASQPAASDRETERSDLNDLDDYDRRPADQVIAAVRATLGVAAGSSTPRSLVSETTRPPFPTVRPNDRSLTADDGFSRGRGPP